MQSPWGMLLLGDEPVISVRPAQARGTHPLVCITPWDVAPPTARPPASLCEEHTRASSCITQYLNHTTVAEPLGETSLSRPRSTRCRCWTAASTSPHDTNTQLAGRSSISHMYRHNTRACLRQKVELQELRTSGEGRPVKQGAA